MSFADLAAVNNAIIQGQRLITAPATAALSNGRIDSIYAPSAPSASGNSLTGPSAAIPVAAPVSGHNLYLGSVVSSVSLGAGWGLYDRLVETGGLSGTTTGAQTVNSVALPTRASGGAGVQLWIEWYTATGATQVTVTATYTNQAGTSGHTTPATNFQVSPSVTSGHEIQQLPLQSGDTGVRSVQSVTLSASTLTAGNFGITLLKPLNQYIESPNVRNDLDPLQLCLPPVTSDMFLEVMFQTTASSGTSAPTIFNFIQD